jgi:integral membrane protein (TIGR01906 family)
MNMTSPTLIAIRSRLVPEVTWPTHARGWAELAAAAVFGICMPLFMVLGSVEYITKSDWLYSYDWWRNGIPETSGLTVAQLNSGADQIKDYFTNDEEYLDLRVEYDGREISLYKEREVLHMKDVKALMKGVFTLVRVSGLVSLLIFVAGLAIYRGQLWRMAMTALRWAALGWGAFVVVFSLAIAINFDWVFTQFHFLSFANDLWQLNPYTDYLLIMFPERFFFEATVIIAIMSVAQFAALMYAVSLLKLKHSGGAAAAEDAPTGPAPASR